MSFFRILRVDVFRLDSEINLALKAIYALDLHGYCIAYGIGSATAPADHALSIGINMIEIIIQR